MTEHEFTEGQAAIIKEAARAIGREIVTELKADFAQSIALHQATCPGQKKIEAIASDIKAAAAERRGMGKGLALALGLGSATGGATIVELIRRMFS